MLDWRADRDRWVKTLEVRTEEGSSNGTAGFEQPGFVMRAICEQIRSIGCFSPGEAKDSEGFVQRRWRLHVGGGGQMRRAAPSFTVATQALKVVGPPLDALSVATAFGAVSIVKHVDIGAVAVGNHSECEVRVQPFRIILVTDTGHLDPMAVNTVDQKGQLDCAKSEDRRCADVATYLRVVGPPAAEAVSRGEGGDHHCRLSVDARIGGNQLHVAEPAARCRSFSGFRTTYSARMTVPSISNAAVCTTPSGASTMTPGSPLTVAKRTLKSSRHH